MEKDVWYSIGEEYKSEYNNIYTIWHNDIASLRKAKEIMKYLKSINPEHEFKIYFNERRLVND